MMTEPLFHDQLTLEEQAEKLGKQALAAGTIPSFAVHYFADSWVFYLPSDNQAEPLTPEEAYLRFKKLIEQ